MHAVLNGRRFASFPCATRFAQTAHQTSCEPFKTTAKFQWFWILYTLILFFSYTRTAIQTTTSVYGERCWLSILVFADGWFEKLVNCCFLTSPNISTNRCLWISLNCLLMNLKIISQYRLTYTLCSGLNSLQFYVIEIRADPIFII